MRALVKEDWPFVVACLKECRTESNTYNQVDIGIGNEDRVRQYYKASVDAGILFGVIEPDKGIMFGGKMHTWYDPTYLEAYEQLLYIRPPHRGGLLAGKMIAAWAKLAKELGVHKAYAGATTGLSEDRTIKLYEKLGWSVSKQSVEISLNVHSRT